MPPLEYALKPSNPVTDARCLALTPNILPACIHRLIPLEFLLRDNGIMASGPASATRPICGVVIMPPHAWAEYDLPALYPLLNQPFTLFHTLLNQLDTVFIHPLILLERLDATDGIVCVTNVDTPFQRFVKNLGRLLVKNG